MDLALKPKTFLLCSSFQLTSRWGFHVLIKRKVVLCSEKHSLQESVNGKYHSVRFGNACQASAQGEALQE
jgi:hypothetical protein